MVAMPRSDNRATRENEGQRMFRRVMDARQEAVLANNRTVAAAHRRAAGPKASSTQETQPPHQRPRINTGG